MVRDWESSTTPKEPQDTPLGARRIDFEAIAQPQEPFQTPLWARVKSRAGFEPLAVEIAGADRYGVGRHDAGTRSHVLALIERFGSETGAAYIPYGPEARPAPEHQVQFLNQLTAELRPHLPSDCAFVRYDLPWSSPYVEGDDSFSGRPDPRLRELRINFGTGEPPIRKAPTDVLPIDTVVIDLRDEPTLLSSMKPKTRYNIRLAYRRGVRVERYRGADLPPSVLEEWIHLYGETARRNGLVCPGRTHFERVFAADARNGNRGHDAKVDLFVAREPVGAGSRALAALPLLRTGARATYLYGASSSFGREHMAPYALQWEAMCYARVAGCLTYDLFGVSPTSDPSHPLYGLRRFKSGFGGRSVHTMGCWDVPIAPDTYEELRARESAGEGFHL